MTTNDVRIDVSLASDYPRREPIIVIDDLTVRELVGDVRRSLLILLLFVTLRIRESLPSPSSVGEFLLITLASVMFTSGLAVLAWGMAIHASTF